MFERTGHRLSNLIGQTGRGIVRQPVVLTALMSEFRLQKKICSRYYPGAIRGGQPPSYSGFEVMPSLVGCVDAPKAHAKREFGERWSAVFFPGGAVNEIGDERMLLAWHPVILRRS